ncbi:SHOCT domain-containing protein [Nocardia concava]|uniref:SHOCT domain-containing protein n=1 Tax=Nocardia concava TaxID=257281 RepID=UPI0002E6BA47|nr:SHOCT domain-containing protein [Nocardia concava]
MSFWEFIWFLLLSFLFIAYLMMLFSIFVDLFRDRDLSGWAKACWVIALLFLPFISALIYLITRGSEMAERSAGDVVRREAAQQDYIRQVARVDPTTRLADAKKLLDQGAISEDEFEQIKRTVLS